VFHFFSFFAPIFLLFSCSPHILGPLDPFCGFFSLGGYAPTSLYIYFFLGVLFRLCSSSILGFCNVFILCQEDLLFPLGLPFGFSLWFRFVLGFKHTKLHFILYRLNFTQVRRVLFIGSGGLCPPLSNFFDLKSFFFFSFSLCPFSLLPLLFPFGLFLLVPLFHIPIPSHPHPGIEMGMAQRARPVGPIPLMVPWAFFLSPAPKGLLSVLCFFFFCWFLVFYHLVFLLSYFFDMLFSLWALSFPMVSLSLSAFRSPSCPFFWFYTNPIFRSPKRLLDMLHVLVVYVIIMTFVCMLLLVYLNRRILLMHAFNYLWNILPLYILKMVL
jgi:hypothetical protein